MSEQQSPLEKALHPDETLDEADQDRPEDAEYEDEEEEDEEDENEDGEF